jgi:hypothetical protein
MALWAGLEEGDGLDAGDVEAFAAADILAGQDVVGADHVALGFGEAGSVTLVSAPTELGLLAADEPSDLVFPGLAAVRAGHGMGSLLGPFVKKVTFFHAWSLLELLAANSAYEFLDVYYCEEKYMASRFPGTAKSGRRAMRR